MKAASTLSGIEKNTASVARRLPRKTRIISDVRNRPIAPSCSSVSIAVFTNFDWSNTTRVTSCEGTSTSFASASRTPSTTAMVLVSPPCFSTGRYTDFCPSTRTRFVWMEDESFVTPRSAILTGSAPATFTGS